MPLNTNSILFAKASSQRLSIVDAASLKPSGNFTIQAWIKYTTASDNNTYLIFASRNNTGGKYSGFELYLDVGKVNLFSAKNTGTVSGTDFQVATSTGTVNDGAWHHIAGTYDGSNLTCFIDGVQDGQTAWTNAAAYNATNYPRIAELKTDTDGDILFFDGKIDEVRLYSVARTGANILSDWKTVLTTYTNLNAYWKMDEGSGTTTADATTNANTATFVNTPTWSTDVPFPGSVGGGFPSMPLMGLGAA